MKIIKINREKYFINKLKDIKENDKEKILKKLIKKNEISKIKIIDSYFSRWKYINKKLDQINNARIIQKFCKIHLRNKLNTNKWRKIYLKLKNKERKNNIMNILRKLKKYLSIIKLTKILKGNNKRNIFDKKFYSYFLDKLNNIKRYDLSMNNLKIIINKQDEISKEILLRNALIKWRNKIGDYEIEKLKGKLLLKIYDKYKISKIKDILKRILIKWENKTIFLDKIKNKINKENIVKFNAKNKKDKIIIILKSILRNINRKNNNINLRKHLNKWKKNIQDRNKNLSDAGNYILKIIKINIKKYIFDINMQD